MNYSNGEFLFYTGLFWINIYTTYKLNNPDYCFIKGSIDYFIENLNFLDVSSFLEVNNTPVFFFFGFLFFTTVIVSWFFFSYLGLYGMFKLNIISLFFFWVSLLLSAKSVFVDHKIYIIKICNWAFLSLNVRVDYYFLIDTISFSFMLLTTTIAFFVYIYAFSYFRYEPLVDRFLLFILSFVISMIFLVTSGNTIMMFLGWELIGLTSFFLINFWTTKTATLKSAFKAFTFNKVSDFFLFIFLISTYNVFYTFDIVSLNNQAFKYEFLSIYIFNTPISYLEFISIMILGAAFIKSAQLGGHAWLPDSMEAPVPASSLIHSATLVSAGIYLILRFNFIFDYTQFSKLVIPVVGSLTAAYGGVCAVAQSDIKKTLAYSTISHCGFLMILCATEMNEFTILYLYVHGFFKAGVFMCVGNVLRITRGYQDTRRMGGLLKYLPFEYFCASIGLFNLAGLPFTFGFFIKHLLLISLDNHIYIYYFVVFNSLIGAFAGLFYSYRLMTYTFNDFKKGNKVLYLNLNRLNYNSKFYTNSSIAATLSIFCLFIFSYIITYFMVKYFLYSNFLFSDYMNTTLLTNYYSILSTYSGYLLNFSYINLTVIVIVISLLFSKYKWVNRYYVLFNTLIYLGLFLMFIFMFFMFI
jgi:NADH-ubiquinone oxidoreductase chain 5